MDTYGSGVSQLPQLYCNSRTTNIRDAGRQRRRRWRCGDCPATATRNHRRRPMESITAFCRRRAPPPSHANVSIHHHAEKLTDQSRDGGGPRTVRGECPAARRAADPRRNGREDHRRHRCSRKNQRYCIRQSFVHLPLLIQNAVNLPNEYSALELCEQEVYSASEMTCIESGGALNSTHSLSRRLKAASFADRVRKTVPSGRSSSGRSPAAVRAESVTWYVQ